MSEFAHATSDASESDDADAPAGELDERVIPETEIAAPGPFAIEHAVAMMFGLMAEVKEQGEDELSDAVGAIDRDIGNRDALGARGLNVDDVVPGGQDGNELQVGELVQELREMLADAMPPVTWLIRSDESVLDATGDFASGFTSQERMWSELLEAGHELGWHMHILSRRDKGGLVLDREPSWLAAAYDALARHYEVRAPFTGWRPRRLSGASS